jgi:hypothetical protein
MRTDDHPAVKTFHETLGKLGDACDEEVVENARKTREKLRKKRRELRKEVNEMLSEDGLEIEDPDSVDCLADEHPTIEDIETPELR